LADSSSKTTAANAIAGTGAASGCEKEDRSSQ
jgi:hypothetical protein